MQGMGSGAFSYSNVMATIAVFAVIGGGAVAIGGVTDKQDRIKACYVKKGKHRGELRLRVKGKCTRKEKGIKWAKQGRQGLPGPQGEPGSDAHLNGAAAGGDLAGTYPNPILRTAEWIDVGSAGGPPFLACDLTQWTNFNTTTNNAAGFLRDPLGFVHLRGTVNCASGPTAERIFFLPAGYRPARNEQFPTITGFGGGTFNGIAVNSVGEVKPALSNGTGNWISLDGITFRCGPSGSNGCP